MTTLNLQPGNIVVTTFGLYQHWSLVTDKRCDQGHYMLISATKRNGTVKEEPWHVVTQGKPSYITPLKSNQPLDEVLAKARQEIDQWQYSVSKRNCEHFVKWVTGMKLSSRQVKAGIEGAVLGGIAGGMVGEKPHWARVLGGAVAVAGLAMVSSRAKKAEPAPPKDHTENKP